MAKKKAQTGEARAKAGAKKADRPKRAARDTYQTRMIIALRGTEGYRDWVERLAEFDHGRTIADLISEALRDRAKKVGFAEKQPNRLER